MTLVRAASRVCNASRIVVGRKTLGVGVRRNVASIQCSIGFIFRCEPLIENHDTKHAATTISMRGINLLSINDGLELSGGSDENTRLSDLSQIRVVGTLPIFEEDDGG
jgi:hypothetical protein